MNAKLANIYCLGFCPASTSELLNGVLIQLCNAPLQRFHDAWVPG